MSGKKGMLARVLSMPLCRFLQKVVRIGVMFGYLFLVLSLQFYCIWNLYWNRTSLVSCMLIKQNQEIIESGLVIN
jgi:hypothetical protein